MDIYEIEFLIKVYMDGIEILFFAGFFNIYL
jgi:hypothetical protein